MLLPQRVEVVVVGAGPTGLALACTLRAAGVEVLVADRAAQGANTSRRDDSALDAYQDRRRPVAQRVVALTDRATRVATLHGAAARTGRNTVITLAGQLPAIRRRLAAQLAELPDSR